jgi:glyoxylase-like metal-dependent hydrolase (beta-lactamase superfamily II)
VLVTHYHPDHAGNVRLGCQQWRRAVDTRASFTVHAARNLRRHTTEAQRELFRSNGLDEARANALLARGGLYKSMVPDFPNSHRRLYEGDPIAIGGREWKVMVGYGHAPEHASLYCGELRVLISGDMLLPRISTNVAVRPIDPRSNPLRLFLESIRRYRDLPADVLVLPSHGLPFRGAHARVAQLEAHHAERLEELRKACAVAARGSRRAGGPVQAQARHQPDLFALERRSRIWHHLHYDGKSRAGSAPTASHVFRPAQTGAAMGQPADAECRRNGARAAAGGRGPARILAEHVRKDPAAAAASAASDEFPASPRPTWTSMRACSPIPRAWPPFPPT